MLKKLSSLNYEMFCKILRLEEEFLEICSFSLLKSKEKNFSEEICSLLKDNVIVISELKNFKTPKKLLKLIRENKNYAKNILSIREKSEIIKSIYKIDIEIERIILSNN